MHRIPCPWTEDGEPQMTADELEHRRRVRDVAQGIWTAEGRPKGPDIEIWFAAEQELVVISSVPERAPRQSRRAIFRLRWRVASVAAAIALCLIFWIVVAALSVRLLLIAL
jgi:hypothetical protein